MSETPPVALRLSLLDPGRRAALELRYAAAVAFRHGGLPAATEAGIAVFESQILRPLLATADYVRATGGDAVAQTLVAACDQVRSVDLSGAGASTPVIKTRIAAFVDLVERAIRNGIEAPLPIQITLLFKSLDNFTARLHQQFHVPPINRPTVFMDLGHLHLDQTPTILASCRLKDQDFPVSIVKLSIRDDSFDWSSACQLPYLLGHELLCHAYQGVAASAGTNEPRVAVDGACAWTEGWMDVMAFWATLRWLDEHEGDPEWIRRESGTLRSAFVDLHKGRAIAQPNLSPTQRQRRKSAREGVDHLLAEMRQFHDGPDREERGRDRVFAFSLNLNALRVPQLDRDRLLDKLTIALDVTVDLDRDELIRVLVEFSARRDWAELDRALTPLSGWT